MTGDGGLALAAIDALARELAPLGPPVVVFNKSHSGSRLLARALDAAGIHMGAARNDSEDATALVPFVFHVARRHYPDFSRLWTEGDPIAIRLARDAIGAHLAQRPPDARWGWKLCETTFALPLVARLFPDAWFVHLLRDGRDVAFSDFVPPNTATLRTFYFGTHSARGYRGLPASEAGYLAAPHLFNARAWVEAVVAGRRFGAMIGPRYVELRYETLVGDFIGTMRQLCRTIGLDADEEALRAVAQDAHGRSVGRHRDAAPEQLVEAMAILGTTLPAFGYGPDAPLPAAGNMRISVVVLAAGADVAEAAQRTVARLGLDGRLFEAILVGGDPADAPVASTHVVVPPGTDEATAAAAGLAAARGTHVVFVRPGYRLGRGVLAQMAADVDAVAAIGAIGWLGSAEGAHTPRLTHQEHLRWLDAVPPGAALFSRDRLIASGAADGLAAEGARWHWRLVRRAAEADLMLDSARKTATVAALPPHPFPTIEMPVRAPESPNDDPDRRVVVCGAPDASLSLFFDGLPPRLRRHLRFMPQPTARRDLLWLAGAGAVILLRDFHHALTFGFVDALRHMEVPFFYMADDHYPTLRREMPQLAFYSEENLAALLGLAAGVIAATPALAAAFRPAARRVVLWPHTIDETLVPEEEDAAFDPPFRRIGMMGGSFRSDAFRREVGPAVAALAARCPVTVVAREDVLDRAPDGAELCPMPFEHAFRRFVFLWRRARVDTIVHPRAATANAVFKSPSALLTSLYLGALPIVPREDAYADVPADAGVCVVDDAGGWDDALARTGDRDERALLARRLRAHCRERFAVDAAVAALGGVLDAARPPDRHVLGERLTWLRSKPRLANLSRGLVAG
ncbi:MAG: sulfotransferase [Alphaproteobacteria bacterium]